MPRVGAVYVEIGFSNLNGLERFKSAAAGLRRFVERNPDASAELVKVLHDLDVATHLITTIAPPEATP